MRLRAVASRGCSQGAWLQVKPKRGRAVVFYNLMHDHESLANPIVHEAFDHKALHNGCDVLDETGVKWAANYWIWNRQYS
jgi:hypothetical protein